MTTCGGATSTGLGTRNWRSAEEMTQIMEADWERHQVVDAARREWEEATTAKAEAAEVREV